MTSWQEELANGFQSAKELLNFLKLPEEYACNAAEQLFKTRVPKAFAARMKKADLNDPLLKQVLALNEELFSPKHFSKDPLEENRFNPVPGLIHKYKNRVLLILSGACAINCRYCFRRHFPYQDNRPGKEGIKAIADYILARPEIDEIILSGGDPLVLNNHYFKILLDDLSKIDHIKTLRIHSRLPIVLPSRIEQDWLSLMACYPWHKVMVTHCNHANEIDASVSEAIRKLKSDNWLVLNQSVLLKGINDDLQTQITLAQGLYSAGILPYYLHLLDPVEAAMHFDVSESEAVALYAGMQKALSGYLLPRLVKERPGELHKSLIRLS